MDHVLFTHVMKPVIRAGNGTVLRKETLALDADGLELLYNAAGKQRFTGDMPTVSLTQ